MNISKPSFVYGLNIKLDVDIDFDELSKRTPGKAVREIKGKGAIVHDLSELNNDYMKLMRADNDIFSKFHKTHLKNALIIEIPKGVDVGTIEINTTCESSLFVDHVIIIAGENSKAAIVEQIKSKDSKESYVSRIVEIFAKENSRLDYGNVQFLNENTIHFTKKIGEADKNSRVNWLDCCFGAKVALSEVTTNLNGQGAETNNHGVFLGKGNQQFDLVANSIHKAPNTYSDIYTKGALTDKSKCVYRGLVEIKSNAAGSSGYQKEDNLLLSDDAVADSIPNLEIDNNDVKCSHGSTIGRIDREKLFYMMSRGLDLKTAEREYVKGFFESLIGKMQVDSLKNKMHDLIEANLR